MSLGFVMLCHTALERAAQVARHWAEQGCPVVIHVDRRVGKAQMAGLAAALAGLDNIAFSPRHACEWGRWSLVAATQDAARMMLDRYPGVDHVYLASGSCLPLRPVSELKAWLEARRGTDFIESVTTADVAWTVGGLDAERFTLRFPFSWQRQRRLFDGYVALQRAVKFRRDIPEGIEPHLGAQWWCLSRRTLTAILDDPRRPEFDRYFARVWIPDESYFQTLARRHAERIESRSLTLVKFDFQGKPHVFYDDHLQLLRRSDCFVARKVWPGAGRLYQAFLGGDAGAMGGADPDPGKIDRVLTAATARRTRGRAGLRMAGRCPNAGWENGVTAAPYGLFWGFDALYPDFQRWLTRHAGRPVHGHLFAPQGAQFAEGGDTAPGGLPAAAALRDYDPAGFLTSLIWNTRGARQTFLMGPRDSQAALGFIAGDPNARIALISGAWAVPLFHGKGDFGQRREVAARLQKIEAAALARLQGPKLKARLRIWSLADWVEAPEPALAEALTLAGGDAEGPVGSGPRMRELAGFGGFLQDLRNAGMQPVLMGDFPDENRVSRPAPPPRRPYAAEG